MRRHRGRAGGRRHESPAVARRPRDAPRPPRARAHPPSVSWPPSPMPRPPDPPRTPRHRRLRNATLTDTSPCRPMAALASTPASSDSPSSDRFPIPFPRTLTGAREREPGIGLSRDQPHTRHPLYSRMTSLVYARHRVIRPAPSTARPLPVGGSWVLVTTSRSTHPRTSGRSSLTSTCPTTRPAKTSDVCANSVRARRSRIRERLCADRGTSVRAGTGIGCCID